MKGAWFKGDWFFFILVFALGIVTGLISQNTIHIEVENKVNISDLLTLLGTIGIGIYIGETIEGRNNSKRFEKDFLIGEIRQLILYLDAPNHFQNFPNFHYATILKQFKELNRILINAETIIGDAYYCKGLELTSVRSSFRNFRFFVTRLNPVNNVLQPTPHERDFIYRSYNALRKETWKAIVRINKY